MTLTATDLMMKDDWEFAVLVTRKGKPLAILITDDRETAKAYYLKHDGNAEFFTKESATEG